jgi:hypothetical protein
MFSINQHNTSELCRIRFPACGEAWPLKRGGSTAKAWRLDRWRGNNGEVLRGIQRSLFVALFTPIGEGARHSGSYG